MSASFELDDVVTVEIENFLRKLSDEAKVDVPVWEWTKKLMVFSRFNIENNAIAVDQIYSFIWADKAQRITIWMLMNYEIAFCFYHYVKQQPFTAERKFLTVPKGTQTRRYAATKSGLSTDDYELLAPDLYGNLSSKLTNYLIKT